MQLILTDKASGKAIVVNTHKIRLLEQSMDGTGTHIVFSADMGRVVSEDLATVTTAIGAVKLAK